MRLPKQLDQIFQLVDQLHNDTSYPVGMTVDECWIHSGNVAGIHKFLLCSDPSFVQCRNGCDELSDGVGVIVLDGILADFYCKFLVQDGISDECRNAVVSKLLHLCKDIQFFFIRETDLPAISDFCFYLCSSQ